MIQDNQIIKGRAVYEWRQLAQKHQVPHATPEQLGEFIDNYHAWTERDYFSPNRRAARLLEDQHMLEEVKEEQKEDLKLMSQAASRLMSAEDLKLFQAEIDRLDRELTHPLKNRSEL